MDVVVVWKFDRSARSLKNLIAGLELCRALGIDFVSVTEAVDTSLPTGEMLFPEMRFQMIGAVAQCERPLIAERVRSSLANARAKGKILGRPPLRRLTQKEMADLKGSVYCRHVWAKKRVCGKLPKTRIIQLSELITLNGFVVLRRKRLWDYDPIAVLGPMIVAIQLPWTRGRKLDTPCFRERLRRVPGCVCGWPPPPCREKSFRRRFSRWWHS
jgi:hypothetical protein